MGDKPEQATELEFLRWFYDRIQGSHTSWDAGGWAVKDFQSTKGKSLPTGYDEEEG
jgi:hypothetical protein